MTRYSLAVSTLALVGALTLSASDAVAQTPSADPQGGPVGTAGTTPPPAATQANDDPAALDPLEPDYALVNLPTTLRLPKGGGNFHLTHRFNDDLIKGDAGDHFSNLFGLDNGANIGLEFRYGLARNLQGIVQRTSISKAVQLSVKYDAVHENADKPVSVSAIISIEGQNNFHNSDQGDANFAPSLGLVLSRKLGTSAIVFAEPFWVHNTGVESDTRDTVFVGLGARLRLGATANLVGEVSPRVGGVAVLGDPLYGFAIEKRVGAHVFSLTFTNRAATTFRQIAQGGTPDNLNLGFNLTRKFF